MGASSEFFAGGYFGHAAAEPEMKQELFDGVGNGNFAVDDLLDFPKEEEMMTDAFFDSITGNSGEAASSSALTVVDSCNSSVSGGEGQFNGDLSCRSFTDTQFSGGELCVPYDDLAELEWLSNFVEESFSTDDLHNLRLISPTTNSKPPTGDSSSATANNNSNNPSPIFPADVAVPAKARSKRSRASPSKWASRLLLLSSPATSSSEANLENNPNPNLNPMNVSIKLKAPKATPCKKREAVETPGRKCLHCGSDKTPQWRTGPMGPKTLCNACGVRYKSGRLVPEYRPAASPTFISAKHSNSHRKVLELRRQKEMMRHHHHHHQQQQHHHQQHQMLTQASMFGVSNGQDDFLIHHHHPHQQNVGPDYRLMI